MVVLPCGLIRSYNGLLKRLSLEGEKSRKVVSRVARYAIPLPETTPLTIQRVDLDLTVRRKMSILTETKSSLHIQPEKKIERMN